MIITVKSSLAILVTFFVKRFEEKLLIRTLPTNLLQICGSSILNSLVIVINIIDPNNVTLRNSHYWKAQTHTYMHTYRHTHIHTYIHTYIHTCMHVYSHTHMHAYIHTHIHTYIHIYIHACIHTYIFRFFPNQSLI